MLGWLISGLSWFWRASAWASTGAMIAALLFGIWYIQKAGERAEQVDSLVRDLKVCYAQLEDVERRPTSDDELYRLLDDGRF